jgi:hypothetical protein
MRAAFQFFFVSFYLLSSYATTQHRISSVVHHVEHTSSDNDSSMQDNCQERVRYTHFREAKKAGVGIYFTPTITISFFTPISFRHFTPRVISLKPQFEGKTSHSRAPPLV